MGKKDTITKDYMNDPRIFADAFNYFIYHGKHVIAPEDLYPLDTAEIALPYGADGKIHPVQKLRDNFKYLAAMQDKDTAYLLLGVEDQSEIHYAMPVKNMLYDSMEYTSQVDKIARAHRRHMNAGKNYGKNFLQKISSGEFLSGFYKEDRLIPVITLVLYFGPEKWDGPLGIHDMMDIRDPALLPYIPDYRINLISPYSITDTEMDQFHSSLREVLLFIKYSKDKERLQKVISTDPRFLSVEQKASQVIKVMTGSEFKINEKEEEIDMCKALDDLKEEGREEGRKEGRKEGRQAGIKSAERKFVRKLLAKKQFTYEEISDMTEVPIDEIIKIESTDMNP